jgi:hypothetical protein
MKILNKNLSKSLLIAVAVVTASFGWGNKSSASSHREAPMIAADPLADNTDLYAFRSPDDTNTVTIIANYIPFEAPFGGPNWYTFGENIRYEIHIKNNATTKGDDITYRFTFTHSNEDATTFFNIRLGKQNIKCTYICEKSTDGGKTFITIVTAGVVPPPNIGPRSINDKTVGLNTTYDKLMSGAITTATGSGGETIFCGPVDDPFFVDLGGAFDLGGFRKPGQGARDGLKGYNVHAICIKVPISSLQKTGLNVTSAKNILDPDFVIGVWASASRPQISTLRTDGKPADVSGQWVQVSRLGMPLTNEVIIPVGMKDKWNSLPPDSDLQFAAYFENPELELYMDTTKYAAAVPGLSDLRIQQNSYTVLGNVNFGYGQPGLYPIKGNAVLAGSALDDAVFGTILLPDNHSPRAVDILPIFYTGVPNLAPYQLATGKTKGNPLSAGKPFINNFLPTLGDLLRLNMATPVTSRTSADFSSLGIVSAAVLGLTDSRFNTNTNIQFIPNMDGFPNGRRLEDDVTTIELQAVGGVALAAIGLWYDDYTATSTSPLTYRLLKTIGFKSGPTQNDTSFQTKFPYVQEPWIGFKGPDVPGITLGISSLNYAPPTVVMKNYPNPFREYTNFDLHVTTPGRVMIQVYDLSGRLVSTIVNENKIAGDYTIRWEPGNLQTGTYLASLTENNEDVEVTKLVISK